MPPLIVVQNDAEYRLVKRRGLFSVPVAVGITATQAAHLEDYPHFLAYVKYYQEKMVRDLAKLGYQYHGGGFILEGPAPHFRYSTDAAPDPGPLPPPNVGPDPGPRGLEALQQWEVAEKAMAARRAGEDQSLVDYWLTGTFRHKVPTSFRSSNFPLGKAIIDPQRPLHEAVVRDILGRKPELREQLHRSA